MRKIYVIQSVAELCSVTSKIRSENEVAEYPRLSDATLIFENNFANVFLQSFEGKYQLDETLTSEEIIRGLAKHFNIEVVIT